MIVPQPASFQISWMVIIHLNHSGLLVIVGAVSPMPRNMWSTTPAPPKICWNRATMMTHEMKCGR